MSRFPIPGPRSSDGTLLPALLVAALGVMLVLQLALVRSDEPEIESVIPIAAPSSTAAPSIATAAAEQVIQDRPIFTPARANASGGAGSDPLGGVQVSGAWSVGRRANLVLRQSDGVTRTIRVGESVNQWVLASITPEGARFLRDGKSMLVPFGASAPSVARAQQTQEEEDQ